jgi:hypothetical protein
MIYSTVVAVAVTVITVQHSINVLQLERVCAERSAAVLH